MVKRRRRGETAPPKWPELRWDEAIDRVAKCVFRVYAGDSAGTCFLFSLGTKGKEQFAMFATAWHVVEPLVNDEGALSLVSADKKLVLNDHTSKMGFARIGPRSSDTAVIFAETTSSPFQESDLLPILPIESMLARGADLGWLGFPGLVEPELCFFHGHVSGFLADPPTYLIDGVAINGVSGGPAFDSRCHLIGLVSAYIPNRIDEHTVLPGLTALVPINVLRYWAETQMGATVKGR